MVDMAREQARMTKMMDLDRRMTSGMMRAMPGVCTSGDVAHLIELRDGYGELKASARPSDMLVTVDTLEERIANVTDWIGRALDSMNQSSEALPYFEEARALYAALGKSDVVAQLDDKIGEINVHVGGGLDAELTRLRVLLEHGGLGQLDRARVLIQLGELLSKAGDDFEAAEHLIEAEGLLAESPNPSDGQLLESLADSVRGIMGSTTSSGEDTPIVRAMTIRALHQRLYFALGNAYRETHPEKAMAYEEKLATLDERSGGLDASVITKLMEQLSRDSEI